VVINSPAGREKNILFPGEALSPFLPLYSFREQGGKGKGFFNEEIYVGKPNRYLLTRFSRIPFLDSDLISGKTQFAKNCSKVLVPGNRGFKSTQ